jgi:integrase/recombinase XerD
MRISEAARLQVNSLSLQEGFLVVTLLGKGGSCVQTVLSKEVRDALEDHLKASRIESGYVFRSSRGTNEHSSARHVSPRAIHSSLKRYARRAGLDPRSIRPHSGRVFFITQAYAQTHDLERVARAVGHRNIATTRRYLRYQERISMHAALSVKILLCKDALAA